MASSFLLALLYSKWPYSRSPACTSTSTTPWNLRSRVLGHFAQAIWLLGSCTRCSTRCTAPIHGMARRIIHRNHLRPKAQHSWIGQTPERIVALIHPCCFISERAGSFVQWYRSPVHSSTPSENDSPKGARRRRPRLQACNSKPATATSGGLGGVVCRSQG